MTAVLSTGPLGFPWTTRDPFLFCVHHDDAYPAGNERMGPPPTSLKGRNIGQDFTIKDGWRMYHGDVVPGFPQHPHRGFETITLARRGYIDHSDSLGATARFGKGDVQWMTAGRGVVHSEMFPLVNRDAPNPTELFQIWLNLPAASKMVDPHFTMLWSDTVPQRTLVDERDNRTLLTVVAGRFGDAEGPPPPPSSWASAADSDVAVWTLVMDAGARVTLPPAKPGSNRTLYFFIGDSIEVSGKRIDKHCAIDVKPDVAIELVNGGTKTELLMLQGKPIGEPVAQYGPFVMNTGGEIQQAMMDYRRTQFGGWPWPSHGPVHPRDKGRFAIHADGREEQAEEAKPTAAAPAASASAHSATASSG